MRDSMDSSESLKALLGIQNNGNANMFSRDGVVTGSPTLQHQTSFSARPLSTPLMSSSSSASHQHGSDALKAILGISATAGSSPLLHASHPANGASPAMSNHAAMHRNFGQSPGSQGTDFSPKIHHASAAASPVRSRNGSVDLLALLKGPGAGATDNGAGNGNANNGRFGAPNGVQNSNGSNHSSNSNSNGNSRHSYHHSTGSINSVQSPGYVNGSRPAAKGKAMQNFSFDMDALI
ncbi:hypothetical protein BGZ72_011111 [Mortierella alpina]|nr:hypothetical protein BGZ72_011111 [Mortierella alpina]